MSPPPCRLRAHWPTRTVESCFPILVALTGWLPNYQSTPVNFQGLPIPQPCLTRTNFQIVAKTGLLDLMSVLRHKYSVAVIVVVGDVSGCDGRLECPSNEQEKKGHMRVRVLSTGLVPECHVC